MRVAVIGKTGQLARALRCRAGPEATVAFHGREALDLADTVAIAPFVAKLDADAIIVAAAYTAVDAAEEDEATAHRINAQAPEAIGAAAAKTGAKVVHVSTDYVFDGTAAHPYREADAPNPKSAYGRTKLAGETALLDALPGAVVLRTAWVHSPWPGNFVATMLRVARERERLSVVADQVGSPTSALDLADAVWHATRRMTAPNPPSGIYHCAGTGETSWAGLARATFEESERLGGPTAQVDDITSDAWPAKAPRPANSRLDCTRFQRDFGHALPHWRDSIAESVRGNLEAGR